MLDGVFHEGLQRKRRNHHAEQPRVGVDAADRRILRGTALHFNIIADVVELPRKRHKLHAVLKNIADMPRNGEDHLLDAVVFSGLRQRVQAFQAVQKEMRADLKL